MTADRDDGQLRRNWIVLDGARGGPDRLHAIEPPGDEQPTFSATAWRQGGRWAASIVHVPAADGPRTSIMLSRYDDLRELQLAVEHALDGLLGTEQ